MRQRLAPGAPASSGTPVIPTPHSPDRTTTAMPRFLHRPSSLAVLVFLAGCASAPTGPSVMALPGTGKSFDDFRRDDVECRQYAHLQIGGDAAGSATTDPALQSGAVGAAVGTVAGALIGGREGAGVGAGTGLLFGSAVGADAARGSTYETQRRYDNAYVQCMYAKGQKVPISGTYLQSSPGAGRPMPAYPPPPGDPPPPPPR